MMQYIDAMLLRAKATMRKVFSDERGDVNVVSIVVLIAVAVVLAILLKDQLSGLISRFIGSIGDKADTILTE